MKALQYIRNSLLTGVCLGLMTGCSWLDDWPPSGSEMARKSAPKPPESKIMETSGGTWLNKDRDAENGDMAMARGIAIDEASADRIAQLESQVQQLSNDISMIMPALTRMAEAQGDIQNALGSVEPAAGTGAVAANYSQQPTSIQPSGNQMHNQQSSQTNNQTSGPAPGTVAWYEEQEKLEREAKRERRQAQKMVDSQYGNNNNNWQQQQQPSQQYNNQQQYNNNQQPPSMAQQAAYQPSPAPQQPSQAQYNRQSQPPPQQRYNQQQSSPPMLQQASYNAAGGMVTNVRFGEHPDKTRLVLDTSDKVSFSYDIDNNEQLLMIQLPGTGWRGAQQMQVSNSPLVDSYSVVPDNQGGHQLVMQLKQPARVLWAQALAPGGPQGHRVVFDLAPM